MKKKILCFVMMICFALNGCSGAEKPEIQQSSQTDTSNLEKFEPQPQNTNVFNEPNSIDDSYIFEGTFSELEDVGISKYIDRWLDNGKLLDKELKGSINFDSGFAYGWLMFSGTPKSDTGWNMVEYNSQQVYCRSIVAHMDENGVWQVKKSSCMQPAKGLEAKYLNENCFLDGVVSADLYVRQLDKSFSIYDAEAISILEKALSPEGNNGLNPSGYAIPMEFFDHLNLLYLHMEDGTTKLVYTDGQGSGINDAWGGCTFNSALSIFELFAVPLEAARHSRNPDGSIEVVVDLPVHPDGKIEERKSVSVYSAEGELIRREMHEDKSVTEENFFYDDIGRLNKCEIFVDGELLCIEDYTYTDTGKIERISTTTDNGTTYYQYNYDELDRLVSLIYYNHDGKEGAAFGNSYYWYDDAGVQHPYGFYPDGSMYGEIPPEGPIRKA